mmetsp:Transcript_44847/g.71991  ORF Transcript_44847/g.71991 Transcript_44847/m.71991 type:complete len:224 (+) Transcript_44847:119-790(+)
MNLHDVALAARTAAVTSSTSTTASTALCAAAAATGVLTLALPMRARTPNPPFSSRASSTAMRPPPPPISPPKHPSTTSHPSGHDDSPSTSMHRYTRFVFLFCVSITNGKPVAARCRRLSAFTTSPNAPAVVRTWMLVPPTGMTHAGCSLVNAVCAATRASRLVKQPRPVDAAHSSNARTTWSASTYVTHNLAYAAAASTTVTAGSVRSGFLPPSAREQARHCV